MEISLQQYRISIGTYSNSCLPRLQKLQKNISHEKFPNYKKYSSNNQKPTKWQFLISILFYSALFSISMIQEENPSETVLEVSCMKHETQLISNQYSQISQNEIINPHLNWGYNISVNKLCHIMYGNRRNVGYKYFSWNCDRGLLSKNKIEDIKQLAARHKPHFMGISEVDLRRNEANPDDSTSNNEFSTEQVHDKLKIEGYRIFLPSSWVENDRARIIVYANEEVGAKILHNAQDDSHLQNILLEVGYGR